jgi:hypothetical protein
MPDGLALIVCGGRDYPNRSNVFRVLDRIHAKQTIECIISGACAERNRPGEMRGADRWAIEWAIAREVDFRGYPARWKKHGKGAGFVRNARMRELRPDGVLGFPGGNGTAEMLSKSHAAGLRVRVADDDGNLREWSEPDA